MVVMHVMNYVAPRPVMHHVLRPMMRHGVAVVAGRRLR
jgi:hypothetical protein